MKRRLFILIVFLILGAIIFFILSQTKIYKRNSSNLPKVSMNDNQTFPTEDIPLVSVVKSDLSVPWALAFLPAPPGQVGSNLKLLVTERSGDIKLIDKDTTTTLLHVNVHQEQESGLHGIAVDPDFNTNQYIYVYYTTRKNGKNTMNRVSRFRFFDEILTDETIIVDNIPGAKFHDGGRIKFGPDDYLYITTGDALNPSLSQNTDSLAGKILRITRDGTAAPGNPFGTLVYSYGHRNPQGITWDSSNQLYETEHGNTAKDEFNKIEVGKNYGWPVTTGEESNIGMVNPIVQSGSETWAPAGLAYVNNKFYFAGLRGSALFEIDPNNGFKLVKHFDGEFGRLREVILGPDNMLYITTSNRDGRGIPSAGDDKILRINPMKL